MSRMREGRSLGQPLQSRVVGDAGDAPPLGDGLPLHLLQVGREVVRPGGADVAAHAEAVHRRAYRPELAGAPPRSPGVSRRTAWSLSPSVSATRSASWGSSRNVSTSTMRGASGSTCLSKATAAFTVSPKQMIMAWGIVPDGSFPALRAPR